LSLIQIPKIEYITLEQFIPNWTEMIEEMDERKTDVNWFTRFHYARVRGLDFQQPKCCLVGEGHKNHHYECYECEEFMTMPAGEAITQGKQTFQAFKLDLFTHMLEAHPQLMIK